MVLKEALSAAAAAASLVSRLLVGCAHKFLESIAR